MQVAEIKSSLTGRHAYIKVVASSGRLTQILSAFGLNLAQEDSFMLIKIGKGGLQYSQETRSATASKTLFMRPILLESASLFLIALTVILYGFFREKRSSVY